MGKHCSGRGNGGPKGWGWGGEVGCCSEPTLDPALGLDARHLEPQMQMFWPEGV